MKFICEILRHNDIPGKKKPDNPVIGCIFAICDESRIEASYNSELMDVYPHYIIFDFSGEEEEPRLHRGFSEEQIHQGMWTVGKSSIFNNLQPALKKLKSDWKDIEKGMVKEVGFSVTLEEILNPKQEEMERVIIDIF